MKVLIHDTAEAAADCVAGLIAARLARLPASVFGLATGGTMEAVNARLIAAYRAGAVSFAQARSFNLDEYVGLAPDHPCSYWRYMAEQLFDHVDMPAGAAALPRGDAPDPEAEAPAMRRPSWRQAISVCKCWGLGRTAMSVSTSRPPACHP